MTTTVRLYDQVLGLVLDDFEVLDIAVEFSGICSDDGIAFADLERGCQLSSYRAPDR